MLGGGVRPFFYSARGRHHPPAQPARTPQAEMNRSVDPTDRLRVQHGQWEPDSCMAALVCKFLCQLSH